MGYAGVRRAGMDAGRRVGSTGSIPLPVAAQVRPAAVQGWAGTLVSAFLHATSSVPCAAAADAAGVRPATIAKWRRRLPRWLRAGTERRLAAYLAGVPAAAPEDGFRRAFRRSLRPVPSD